MFLQIASNQTLKAKLHGGPRASVISLASNPGTRTRFHTPTFGMHQPTGNMINDLKKKKEKLHK